MATYDDVAYVLRSNGFYVIGPVNLVNNLEASDVMFRKVRHDGMPIYVTVPYGRQQSISDGFVHFIMGRALIGYLFYRHLLNT